MIYSKKTNNLKDSRCRCPNYIGVLITDEKGNPIDGNHIMEDGTLIRFRNGYIDGGDLAAIEYENGGIEFWVEGFPHGFPAIVTDYGSHEEDWNKGTLIEVRSYYEFEDEDKV